MTKAGLQIRFSNIEDQTGSFGEAMWTEQLSNMVDI